MSPPARGPAGAGPSPRGPPPRRRPASLPPPAEQPTGGRQRDRRDGRERPQMAGDLGGRQVLQGLNPTSTLVANSSRPPGTADYHLAGDPACPDSCLSTD